MAIPYADLPGFPHAGVSGHNPTSLWATWKGVRVAVFGGREHYYECGNPAAMRLPLEVLKALGAEILILTNNPRKILDRIFGLTDLKGGSGLLASI